MFLPKGRPRIREKQYETKRNKMRENKCCLAAFSNNYQLVGAAKAECADKKVIMFQYVLKMDTILAARLKGAMFRETLCLIGAMSAVNGGKRYKYLFIAIWVGFLRKASRQYLQNLRKQSTQRCPILCCFQCAF